MGEKQNQTTTKKQKSHTIAAQRKKSKERATHKKVWASHSGKGEKEYTLPVNTEQEGTATKQEGEKKMRTRKGKVAGGGTIKSKYMK